MAYKTFKSEFVENHHIRTREGTSKETKVSIGVWRGQEVALKKCPKRRESKTYSKIPPHPNIISLKGVMSKIKGDKKSFYILMEGNSSGLTLSDGMYPTEDVNEALSIMHQITSAVKHLHDNGMIHHDIKKSNVLMMDDHKTFKLCDFGLTEFVDVNGHGDSRFRVNGTPNYRAPEQDKDSTLPITQKIDIYALGKIGKSILMEEYDGDSQYEFDECYECTDDEDSSLEEDQKEQEEFERERILAKTKTEKYFEIMRKCMSLNPDDRYSSIELLEKLTQLINLK